MDLAHPLAVVTPTVDGDVLSVLALTDLAFTAGQLGRMLTQHSEDGIRRVLRRLDSQGIVESERAGNAYLYRLNRRHLAAGPIMELARIPQTLRARLDSQLATWAPAPVYAAVFGSAARGGMRLSSDIDLLLIRPDNCDEEQWERLVVELETDVTAWTGNDARVLEFSEAEVRNRGAQEPVLADVLGHGLTIAGTVAWLSRAMRGVGRVPNAS